jgi:hypothetical protein
MISVRINDQQREGLVESWIAQTVNGFRHDRQAVCVRVTVKGGGLDLMVTAGGCQASPGASRPPNERERRVLDRWKACGLDGDPDFSVGQLIRCLTQLEREL